MLLAREDFDKADATFIEAGAEWDAVLGLLIEKYSIFNSESELEIQETLICPHQFDVDRKYTMQCQPQNVKERAPQIGPQSTISCENCVVLDKRVW